MSIGCNDQFMLASTTHGRDDVWNEIMRWVTENREVEENISETSNYMGWKKRLEHVAPLETVSGFYLLHSNFLSLNLACPHSSHVITLNICYSNL